MNRQAALIVTFYAFKGGTGRTLALSNVARILAEDKGYRVGLIDLDLDSPGLVHEPLCEQLEQEQVAERRSLLKLIDKKKGFLECFLESSCQGDARTDVSNIDDFVIALPNGKRSSGCIFLMPTASGAVSKSPDFSRTVEKFMGKLDDLSSEGLAEDSVNGKSRANLVTWSILSSFSERYKLDYLLIDGRTGAGPFSPTYVYSVPHLLVLFFGLNDQNVIGSLSVLRKQTDEQDSPVPVFLVASPVPTVGPAELEQRLSFVAQFLAQEHRDRKKEVQEREAKYIYELPQSIVHQLPYCDAAAFGEIYFPGRYPNSGLTAGYKKLASAIEGLVIANQSESVEVQEGQRNSLLGAVVSSITRRPPVQIAVEDVHIDILNKEFVGMPEFQFQNYAAENSSAPWKKLLDLDDGKLEEFLPELPDVVAVPQSSIPSLAARNNGQLLYNLSTLRHSPVGSFARGMHFDFLDSHYANWRKCCTVEQGVVALPFSVNATVLAGNTQILNAVCERYWKDRSQSQQLPFFLPSNWRILAELIFTARKWGLTSADVFGIVNKDVGLYYDWLNFVASMGCVDVMQSEGRLIEDVGLDREPMILATEEFVRLAQVAAGRPTMVAQIRDFADCRLGMYVGWTDSFRFKWRDGRTPVVRMTALQSEVPEDEAEATQNEIQLAYCPRNMRNVRTSLVDSWVMVFPRKSAEPTGVDAGLSFAAEFLNLKRQRKMLRLGFPTGSSWAIEREIDELRFRRIADTADRAYKARPVSRGELSFEVFLNVMKLAMAGGTWVAAPKSRIDQVVVEVIDDLIQRNAPVADIRRTMQDLNKRVRSVCLG